jgi:glutathione S-transferase
MITLYTFNNSVCCQKVRVVLAEKNLDWDAVEVNLFTNEQYLPEYLRLNPNGTVPTLIHEGNVVNESTVICEYLDETFPDPSLTPENPLGRAQMRLWPKFVDEGLHEAVGAISFSAVFRERMRAMTPEQRQARYTNTGDPKRGDVLRDTYERGAKSRWMLFGIAAFEHMFKRLEAELADGRPWIMGDRATLADIGLMPYVARLDYLNLLDLWTAGRPRTEAWWQDVRAWPSYRAGIVTPMTTGEVDEMSLHGPKIRDDVADALLLLRKGV